MTLRIEKNDCPWTVAKKNLQKQGCKKIGNPQIIKEMQRLAKLNGFDNVDDFGKKFVTGAVLIDEEKVTKKPIVRKVVKKDTLPPPKIDSNYISANNTRISRDSLIKDSVKHHNIKLKVSKNDSFKIEAAKINNIKGDKNRVIEYNKMHGSGNYVIVDKKSCTATVYNKAGQVLKSYEVLLGATKGDDFSTAFAEDKNLVLNGRRTVPGEYKFTRSKSTFGGMLMMGNLNETNDPDVKNRKFAPGGKKKFGGFYQAIHNTADANTRNKYYANKNLADNRQSMGCINIPPENFNEMKSKYGIGIGSKVYILPETKGNELILTKRQDGEVKFVTKYRDPVQNKKREKIQTAIAQKNITKRTQVQKQLAKQQRKNNEFSILKPSTWFS